MALCRKIPFLTFVTNPYRKAKINLSGCNFDCRGCFAIAKNETGRTFSVEGLLDLLARSCQLIYGEMADDVQMTGGEPTTDSDFLLALIRGLRDLGVRRIGVSTNGHRLDRETVDGLRSLSVDYVKLDLKVYNDKVHEWYTGKSNINVLKAARLLHESGLNFYVRTIFMPDIVDVAEIEQIARYLSAIDRNILYRLYQFAPEQLDVKFSRSPTDEEMRKAYDIAREHLNNVECFIYSPAKTCGYRSPYEPDYEIVEVRADELLERFQKIDEIAKSINRIWNVRYFTMNQVLSSVKAY